MDSMISRRLLTIGPTDKSCENISDLLSIESTEIPKRQLNFVPYIPDIFVYVFTRAFVHCKCIMFVYRTTGNPVSEKNPVHAVRFQENPRIR